MNYNLKLFIRRVFLTLSFFLYMIGVHAVPSENYCLVIEFKDGATQMFLLSSRPNVGFVDNQFVISQGDSKIEFAFNDVAGFAFADNNGSSVKRLRDEGLSISFVDNLHLIVNGATSPTDISITNIDGKKYPCDIRRQDVNTISVSFETLSSGVYVVSIGKSRTFIIVRK